MSTSLPSSFEEPDPQDRHTSPLQPSHPSFLLAGNNQEKQKQHRDALLLSLTAAEQNQAVWTLRRHSSAGRAGPHDPGQRSVHYTARW